MSLSKTGSCLCGAVQLKVQGTPLFTNLCHCTTCQKSSGVVYASMAAFYTSDVTYTLSTPDIVKIYEDHTPESGSVVYRRFCTNCGSRVGVSRNLNPELVSLPTGILDDPEEDLKPAMELFCRRRKGWVKSAVVTRGEDGEEKGCEMEFEGLPPMMADFAEKGKGKEGE